MPQPPHGIASGAGPPLTSSTGGVLGHDAMYVVGMELNAIDDSLIALNGLP